jgi:S-adenosylhomocysteine hydrolase
VRLTELALALHSRQARPIRRFLRRVADPRLPQPRSTPLVTALRRRCGSWALPDSAFLWPSVNMLLPPQPGQLLNLFAAVGQRGRVSRAAVSRAYGEDGRRLFDLLAGVAAGGPDLSRATPRHLLSYLEPPALRAVVRDLRVRQPMAQLARLRRERGPFPRRVRTLWGHAHLLADTAELLRSLDNDRMSAVVWGKPYSTDPLVAARLHLDRYHVRDRPFFGDAPGMVRALRYQLKQIEHPERLRKPRFVIFDDGGEVIKAAAELVNREFPRHAHLVAAAENTTRGITRLSRVKLPFVVVDIARSWAKTRFGSPMLGYSVYRQGQKLLEKLARDGFSPPRRRVVLIGYGRMGRAIAGAYLEGGWDVVVHDRSRAVLRAAAAEHAGDPRFRTVSRKAVALEQANVLVSCAGATTLTNRWLRHLPDGAIVINAGSRDELRLRRTRGTHPVHHGHWTRSQILGKTVHLGGDGHTGQRHAVWQSAAGTRVFVAKNGGVINFPGGFDPDRGAPIPGRYIQLPIGLMYLGLKQAAAGGRPGIAALEIDGQVSLARRVHHELLRRPHAPGQRPESLLHPRW